MSLPTGKQLAFLFFSPEKAKDNVWICEVCQNTVRQSLGYTNLCNHLNRHHPNVIQERAEEAKKQKRHFFSSLTYPRKAVSIHGWLECVTLALQPFSFVSNDVIRRHIKHDDICYKTLISYMHKLMRAVEQKIQDSLPEKFAIIFDGWSAGDNHFVGVFATYPATNDVGYEKVLLGFSPMENEASQDAAEHYNYMEYVLEVHGKSYDNVVAIVGDNTSTNKAFARRRGPVFVGCHSHRFNLAVKDILEDHTAAISKVQELMHKLCYHIPAAMLRRLTPLSAFTANVTRWSSTHAMLKRYVAIREFITEIDLTEISLLLLSSEGKTPLKCS